MIFQISIVVIFSFQVNLPGCTHHPHKQFAPSKSKVGRLLSFLGWPTLQGSCWFGAVSIVAFLFVIFQDPPPILGLRHGWGMVFLGGTGNPEIVSHLLSELPEDHFFRDEWFIPLLFFGCLKQNSKFWEYPIFLKMLGFSVKNHWVY